MDATVEVLRADAVAARHKELRYVFVVPATLRGKKYFRLISIAFCRERV